jgi:hypothetical protein
MHDERQTFLTHIPTLTYFTTSDQAPALISQRHYPFTIDYSHRFTFSASC